MQDHIDELTQLCGAALGEGVVTGLTRLSGGASMESWRFSFDGKPLVLRRLPFQASASSAANDNDVGAISLATQAGLIDHLHGVGLKVPRVIAQLPPDSRLGEGFIMTCVAGEALPSRLLNKPEYGPARARLSAECAIELARIHSLDTAGLPVTLPRLSPRELLEEQEGFYRQFGSANAVFELAFAWLSQYCPEPQAYRLVHADFRMGNFLVDTDGLTAVLDWELAHIGDPLRDISFLCIPSWRFGHYDLEAGGFAALTTWLDDYERASGQVVPRESFEWWMIFNILWWGVTCLRLGSTYRDGSVPSVERTVIGRRVSEVEVDLLLALGKKRDRAEDTLGVPPAVIEPELPLAGDITYPEMAGALENWNRTDVLADASGHTVFAARVANNALGIVRRALLLGPDYATRQSDRLEALGYSGDALCAALRDDFTLCHDDGCWNHLRLTTLERLMIDQPHYAGRAVALGAWCEDRIAP